MEYTVELYWIPSMYSIIRFPGLIGSPAEPRQVCIVGKASATFARLHPCRDHSIFDDNALHEVRMSLSGEQAVANEPGHA